MTDQPITQEMRLEIPVGEVTLAEACRLVTDKGWFLETMPPILQHYQITPTAYWELTVDEHRALWDWLTKLAVVEEQGEGDDDG